MPEVSEGEAFNFAEHVPASCSNWKLKLEKATLKISGQILKSGVTNNKFNYERMGFSATSHLQQYCVSS